MLHFDTKSKNYVYKRKISLKKLPCEDEYKNFNMFEKFKWEKLKYIKHDLVDNTIIISSEQAECTLVLNIVDFITDMACDGNIEKIIYEVRNNDIDIIISVWEDYFWKDEIEQGKDGNLKKVHRGYVKSTVIIEDIRNGKKYHSYNGTSDNKSVYVNGTLFPAWSIITNGRVAIEQLEYDGTITNDIIWKDYTGNIVTFENNKNTYENIEDKVIGQINVFYLNGSGEILNLNDFNSNYDTINVLIEKINSGLVSSIDISVVINNINFVLNVRGNGVDFAIGIINEYEESVSYYNNGDNKEGFTELAGEAYPNYMISNDINVISLIIDHFVKTGEPLPEVAWIVEEC